MIDIRDVRKHIGDVPILKGIGRNARSSIRDPGANAHPTIPASLQLFLYLQ